MNKIVKFIMSESKRISVLVWGHSYVRRLQEYCEQQQDTHNLGLSFDKHSIFFKARGGGKSIHAKLDFKVIDQVGADMVVLDIGTNDLDSERVSPNVLAREVFDAASTIQYMYPQVKRIVILEVLFRTPNGTFPLHNRNFFLAAHQYNNKVKILVNSQPDRQNAKILFWHHKGLTQNWQSFIMDGVHLTPEGMKKYFSSIRRLILRLSPAIRNHTDD